MALLQEVVQQNPNHSRQQEVISNVCITRWVEKLGGYNQFLLAYSYLVEASINYIRRNIQTGVNKTLNQEKRHLHCLQVWQHLSFALFRQQLTDRYFNCVVLLKRYTDEVSIYWTLQDRQKSLAKILLSFETAVPGSIFSGCF